MNNKKIIIIFVIALLAVLSIILLIRYYLPATDFEKDNTINSKFIEGNTTIFKFIDGDTHQPISNKEIYICDDSVEVSYRGKYPLSRFCDGEHREIIGKVSTDAKGELIMDTTKINIRPTYNIVFDIGNSDDRRGIVKVEHSDSIGHTYNPTYLRVLNQERSGHVISNKLYNLETKIVKEIFTSDKEEKEYLFDQIELKIYRK